MKRFLVLLTIVVLATGCASTRIINKNPMDTEQPWEAFAIPLDIFSSDGMTIVALDVPSLWLGDGLGIYDLKDERGNPVGHFPIVRKNWTVVIFIDGQPRFFPAIINRYGTRIFILCSERASQIIGRDFLVLSGSRKYCLTGNQEIIQFDGKKVVLDPEKRSEFFKEYSSKISEEMVREVSFSSAEGQQFLQELVAEFSKTVVVDGKQVAINCNPAVFGQTNSASMAERIAGSLSINVSPEVIVFPPIEIARILINATLAASDRTLTGSFFEAKVTALQATSALDVYNNALRGE